ncbi:MAG: hypothetical protein ACOH1M_01245 [Rhodoglobus sp.]
MGGTDGSPQREERDEHTTHTGDSAGDSTPVERTEKAGVRPQVRKRRRVTTAPPAGSDPHPTGEAERHAANENDERLKGDKPPHWG